MHTLRVQHVEGTNQFQVIRLKDGKQAEPVDVPSPVAQLVGARANSSLMAELRWYLEHFLDYPFPPETEHAQEVQQALKAWGRAAFAALFGGGRGRDFLRRLTDAGETVCLQVASDHASFLAWPWEALEDTEAGHLAFQAGIERRLNKVLDPPPLFDGLPKDRVNILLVICRPYDHDVGFRSIARPLVELIAKHKLPAKVTVLRPPTFDRLREALKEQKGQFHIVHFDGHGGYGQGASLSSPHVLQGPQGHLVFEGNDVDPKPDLVSADKLRDLLREYRVPAVVLNACQSATLDEHADDPFASVAASLIKGGVRSVVAMAYSLYVSAAQHFLPAYYRTLFEDGDAVSAVRAGRRELLAHPERVCSRGTCPLDDWLVPVVYQNDPLSLSFGKAGAEPAPLPEEAQDNRNPYGFVGRDQALLRLERAMRRPAPAILIHGLGGVGKTTLARGFLEWLKQTDGLGGGVLWLSFQEIRSAEYVVNQIIQMLFGPDALVAPLDQKLRAVVQALRERPVLLVWDNFESASGIEGSAQTAMLSPEDRGLLKELLQELRGGKSKVLITSRSPEAWLGPTLCYPLPLAGLFGEERWSFCQAILRDLGLPANQDDPELAKLMDALDGHPLMMRAVLPELAHRRPAEILKAVQNNLGSLGHAGDEVQAKLFATLRFVEQSLPEDLRPLLVPLALHDRFVDGDFLEDMAKQIPDTATRPTIDRLLTTLGHAGLVTDRGQAIFELHPALAGYLRSLVQTEDPANLSWARAFVDVMGRLADRYSSKELHEQRGVFHMHGENFQRARALAERLGVNSHFAALTRSMATFAQHTRDFAAAERLYERLAQLCADKRYAEGEAAAYHHLGMVAQERRDFDKAETWYLKSLAIFEKHGLEQGAASTYHQLGMVAQERGDFDKAETWYLKSLAIEEKHGNEHGAAKTYHQLGTIALERRDFDKAEAWYRKSLVIEERHGKEHGAANTYHQLGRTAEGRGHFDEAETWYLKSLAIDEKHGNEHGAANTYHHLGIVAQERGYLDKAEAWYLKSLTIREKHDDTYGAAIAYGQLGTLAGLRENYEASVKWFLRALQGLFQTNDSAGAQLVVQNIMVSYKRAPVSLQPRLRHLWNETGLGPFPEEQT
jgi:tetratricopeptide (TPR) repeat protein